MNNAFVKDTWCTWPRAPWTQWSSTCTKATLAKQFRPPSDQLSSSTRYKTITVIILEYFFSFYSLNVLDLKLWPILAFASNSITFFSDVLQVSTLKFSTINQIPTYYSVGQLTWKPDSLGLVGVAWYNHPFPMACPACTNRNSKIFTTNLAEGSDRKFLTLTSNDLHVYAPRLTPDGKTLIYFENDLVISSSR